MQKIRLIPKILFGLLVAGVSVFGMQSSVDALEFGTSRSGDLQTVRPNEDFEITFSVSLKSSDSIEDADGERISQSNTLGYPSKHIDSSGYVLKEKDGDREDPAVQIADRYRYHYNEEVVEITVTGARIKAVEDREVTQGISRKLYDTEGMGYNKDDIRTQLSSSIDLTLVATAVGVVIITITDNTPREDTPSTHKNAPNQFFEVYVVKRPRNVGTGNIKLSDGKNGVAFGDQFDNPIGFGGGKLDKELPLHIEVEGPGSVYVYKSSTRQSRAVSELDTSTDATVYLDMNGGTNTVTAWVPALGRDTNDDFQRVTYIYESGDLQKIQGDGQTGAIGGRLEAPLGVKLVDSRGRAVAGIPIGFKASETGALFIPYPGATVYVVKTGKLASKLEELDETTTNIAKIDAATTIYVQTDSSGEARTYFQLPNKTEAHSVTATPVGGITAETFRVTAVAGKRSASLEIVSGDGQRADKGKSVTEPLVVIARSTAGYRIPDVEIRFFTLSGTLDPSEGTKTIQGKSGSGNQIFVKTNAHGTSSVTYNVGQLEGTKVITAEVDNEKAGDIEYDFEIDRVTFTINGRAAPAPDPTPTPTPTPEPRIQPPSLSADISGAPGSTQTLSVNTEAIAEVSVGFSTDSFLTAGGRVLQRSFTGSRDVSIVLPNRVGIYTLTVTASTAAGGTSRDQRSIRVVEADNGGAGSQTGTLSVVLVGAQANGHQTLQVNAQTTAGAAVSGTLTVTLSGAGVSTTVATTNGSVRTIIALPATAGILTASATGYTSGLITLPARTTPTTPTTPTTTLPTVSEPSRITIGGAATRSGTVNEELEAPLLVRALDDNGDGVEDARVIFRVISGRGKLSDRGTGRAIGIRTDSNGYARADFTPLSAGSITVEAEVRGVNTPVTFTITTGSTPPTTGTTSTGGTPSTDISPVVHVAAASRPPMLWVEGGAIYALVGANIQKFAPSVDNALNLAVGGGKVYWTEKTGDSGGTINSANLDGTGVTELASIFAIPMGIAVDAAGSQLYWTASSGKIKRANLDGSGSENVVPGGLDTPMDLALADGNVYWTQGNGSVRFASLTGQKVVRNITPIGADTPGSLVIAGGKVYWTEKTAASAGTINSANLNGTDVRELTSIRSVPMGIAVDTARSKLYWTASSGKVKQANLNGSGAKNVVSGLGSPSDMVLSNSITETPAATTTTTTTTASRSKYDLNSDGTVDNTDAGLVADAMGTSNARYDVNGDGTVNFLDLLLVFDNRDPGAAGAPTIVGMKMSAAQIDIIEEQIDLLIATNDRSPSAMRTLVYLQQLLVTARPEKTRLLANYPNPFNPETWMPYELATDTPVKITIYTPQGVVIRTLQLGHQSAGYYVGRDRAAYWDGRNALGEQVASGLYFYQLETDEMSLMRKMVILK